MGPGAVTQRLLLFSQCRTGRAVPQWSRIQAASAVLCSEVMRQAACAPCRRCVWYAATAAVLLTVVHRFSQGSVPAAGRDTVSESSVPGAGGAAPRCSDLSIVCLADSVPAGAARSLEEAVQSLRSRQRHVVLAGHSRLRQVFEQLQPLLGAPLRTRADQLPPLADTDDPGAPALLDNSTCLAAVPKLHRQALWCSMAADCGRLLLDFRWRYRTERASELLDRLAARPPHRLVLGHGLYQAKTAADVLHMRLQLPPLVTRLHRLQRLGTHTVGMLEAGASAHAKEQLLWTDDSLLVMNGLLVEVLVAAGVPLWSSHLPLVLRWLLTDCQRPPPVSAECTPNHMHTNPATNLQLAFQLLSVMTDGPS